MIDEPMTCPFCGGGPELFTKRNFEDEWVAYLSCGKCDVEMMDAGATELDADAAVIEKWNERHERVCRLRVGVGGWFCLECGVFVNSDCIADAQRWIAPRYCPNCGAKVMGGRE